jgi:hypothetical protein
MGKNRAGTGVCPYNLMIHFDYYSITGQAAAPTKNKWISRCTGINDPLFMGMTRVGLDSRINLFL